MTDILVRKATLEDLTVVSDILYEAALWLKQRNMTLWEEPEISAKVVLSDIRSSLFYIAFYDDIAAGVVKFQTEDLVFWSDVPHQDSAFIHRLAVRRSFAGGSVSTALMRWAVDRSRQLGKRYLRLDCDAKRTSLRSVYENFGFRHHSDKRVGSYFVARYEYKI